MLSRVRGVLLEVVSFDIRREFSGAKLEIPRLLLQILTSTAQSEIESVLRHGAHRFALSVESKARGEVGHFG